jgi:hypothetical protein
VDVTRRGWRDSDGEHRSDEFREALLALHDVVGELVTVRVLDAERRNYITKYGRLEERGSRDDEAVFGIGELFFVGLPREAFVEARWGCDADGMLWGITFDFGMLQVNFFDNLNHLE